MTRRRTNAAPLLAAAAVLFSFAPAGPVRADDESVRKEIGPVYQKAMNLLAAGSFDQLPVYATPDVSWKGADGKVRRTDELAALFLGQFATLKNAKIESKIDKILTAGDTAVLEVSQTLTGDRPEGGKTLPFVEKSVLRQVWVKGTDGAWRARYLETLKSDATLDGKTVAGVTGGGTAAPAGGTASPSAQPKEVTTASGLKYEDLKVGTGTEAKPTSTVVVHYTGTLTDGTKFDSSRDRGEPTQFPLSGVIPGFKEGISGMKVGGRRKLTIPPALGYGPSGAGGVIPPNATLIFDVELIEVK